MPRTVATIGSSSHAAKPVIKAMLAHGHQVTALTRAPNASLEALGATVKVVDYDSEASLAEALQGIHTVISFAFTWDGAAMVAMTQTLIAAMKAAGVARFAPSEWAFTKEANQHFLPYPPKDAVWALACASGLEITAFRVGSFMNYLAVGSTKPGVAEEGTVGVADYKVVLDGAAGRALVPGSGDDLVTFTRTQDIAEFVARAVDLETWDEESGMAGEATTWNNVLDIFERVSGRTLERVYESEEVLLKRERETDGIMKTLPQLGLMTIRGMMHVQPDLNKKTGYVPMGVEEFLTLWWGA